LEANIKTPDAVDEKLLGLLERDARRPVMALARAVGLSRSAVQERLARLERDGIIAGYTLMRGGRKAAVSGTRAVLLVGIESRPCDTVIRLFKDWTEIKACYSVAGEFDAILLVDVASPEALGELRNRLAALSGVSAITTAPVLRTLVDRPSV
jgi:Lrp/AsnC family leucine-responsive transcriptional regulator